ncbi:MAG: lipoate--protein ligase family protein [Gemmataceae bacterium]
MYFLDLTLPSPAENVALDEALLLAAESGDGGEILRFWEWTTPAIVLGSGGKLADDVHEEVCSAEGVPILRRSSGGGTVLLDRGCLLYTLILSYERHSDLADIRRSYRFILDRIAYALAENVGPIEQAGISDLVRAGRKFSGTAQQRKRAFLLHHGTLLHDMDLSAIRRYLREPPKQPEYREGRCHLDFLRNLPLRNGEIKRRLRRIWDAGEASLSWPAAEVRRLVVEKYANPLWTRRR